jgi:hypothetical protein
VLTCTVENHGCEDVGAFPDGDFGIAARTGLHCAPLVHRDLGPLEGGAVRFSLCPLTFTTETEIDCTTFSYFSTNDTFFIICQKRYNLFKASVPASSNGHHSAA